jgi:hypothetical protein
MPCANSQIHQISGLFQRGDAVSHNDARHGIVLQHAPQRIAQAEGRLRIHERASIPLGTKK